MLGQSGDGLWSFNEIRFPRDRTAPLNFGGFVSESLTWAGQALLDTQRTEDLEAEHGPPPWWPAVQPILAAVGLDDEVEAVGRHLRGVGRAASRMQRELTAIFLDVDSAADQGRRPEGVLERFADLTQALLPPRAGEPPDVRFRRDTIALLLTVLRGVWADKLLERGFDHINHLDLAEWLEGHGLELAGDPIEWPALLRAVYDGCFAFDGGDVGQPSMAAGRALQGAVRCLFHYRGSVLYRPRGSMSDVVVGPLASVLEERGVVVRYFHAAKELRPSADGSRIEEIDIVRQLDAADGAAAALPERERGAARTWSTVPPAELFEGLEAGSRSAVELEEQIDPFGGETLTLRGDGPAPDFDIVILAVPPEVQKQICAPLAHADRRYARMLGNSRSVVTQASQIWLRHSPAQLEQPFESASLLSCYVEPLDTYADMAHISEHEQWEAAADVRHIAYFCGVLPEKAFNSQETADELAAEELARFLERDAGRIWPAGSAPGSDAFDLSLLVRRRGADGEDPLAFQLARANWAPTARYVLTLPGSVTERLAARDTRFGNLVLAGDWTRTGFDAGCLEAAVTSGRLASQAICGHPVADNIPGVGGPPGFANEPSARPGTGLWGAVQSVAGGGIRLIATTARELRRIRL